MMQRMLDEDMTPRNERENDLITTGWNAAKAHTEAFQGAKFLATIFPPPTEAEVIAYAEAVGIRAGFRRSGAIRDAREHLDPARRLRHLSMMLHSDADDMGEDCDCLPIPKIFIRARQEAASEALLILSNAMMKAKR